ncbi:MAG: hypothetical protein ACHQAZ_05840 [Gammaproteobacteria bacterium]|jgi:predicted nucleic acid-binding Zn ribbon protein|nr:hypothetical protein [Gammaproteobacteria bacterium]
MAETREDEILAKNRRRALRTVVLLGLVALAFYVGIFLIVSWRHP